MSKHIEKLNLVDSICPEQMNIAKKVNEIIGYLKGDDKLTDFGYKRVEILKSKSSGWDKDWNRSAEPADWEAEFDRQGFFRFMYLQSDRVIGYKATSREENMTAEFLESEKKRWAEPIKAFIRQAVREAEREVRKQCDEGFDEAVRKSSI